MTSFMATFLLVVYLFLSDGTVVSSRFEGIPTMTKCLELGREKARWIWDQYNRDGDFSFMCIRKEEK